MVAKHYDPIFRPVSSIWHNWSLLETLSLGFLECPLLGFLLSRWPLLLLLVSLSLNVGESKDQPSACWMSFLLYPHSVLRPVELLSVGGLNNLLLSSPNSHLQPGLLDLVVQLFTQQAHRCGKHLKINTSNTEFPILSSRLIFPVTQVKNLEVTLDLVLPLIPYSEPFSKTCVFLLSNISSICMFLTVPSFGSLDQAPSLSAWINWNSFSLTFLLLCLLTCSPHISH